MRQRRSWIKDELIEYINNALQWSQNLPPFIFAINRSNLANFAINLWTTMKISGFSFGRSASKLYYPIKAFILSVLHTCYAFVFVLRKGAERTKSLVILDSVFLSKLKINHTQKVTTAFSKDTEKAYQTEQLPNKFYNSTLDGRFSFVCWQVMSPFLHQYKESLVLSTVK